MSFRLIDNDPINIEKLHCKDAARSFPLQLQWSYDIVLCLEKNGWNQQWIIILFITTDISILCKDRTKHLHFNLKFLKFSDNSGAVRPAHCQYCKIVPAQCNSWNCFIHTCFISKRLILKFYASPNPYVILWFYMYTNAKVVKFSIKPFSLSVKFEKSKSASFVFVKSPSLPKLRSRQIFFFFNCSPIKEVEQRLLLQVLPKAMLSLHICKTNHSPTNIHGLVLYAQTKVTEWNGSLGLKFPVTTRCLRWETYIAMYVVWSTYSSV